MNSKHLFIAAASLFLANGLFAYSYTVQDLGTPLGYRQSTAVDITNSGWIAVNGLNAPEVSGGFVLSGGVYHAVPHLAPTPHQLVSSINDAGNVVGTEWSGPGASPTGFYYNLTGGVLAERAFSFSGNDYARVINDAGQILGGATDWGAGSWIYSGGSYFDVDSTVPALSLAYDINNNGIMVAYNGTLGGYYVWDSKHPGVSTPHLATNAGQMTLINDDGLLAGKSLGNLLLADSTAGGWGTAPLVNAGSLGLGVEDVNDINDLGYVVGSFGYTATTTGAFLYNGMALLDLNTVVDPALGWTLSTARGLNDLGQIVGAGYNAEGQYHAYLLTPVPVPEPSTYGLVATVTLGGLIYLRRRRR